MPRTPAIAYLRTSSATNVGQDRDSDRRQRQAVTAYAKRSGYEIVREYYDAAVSGADPIDTRPGFIDMLTWASEHGVKTIIVEAAHRFARDLMVQEAGYATLTQQGFVLIAADRPDAFLEDTPTSVMVRQILGSVSQFEKTSLVAKLRGARDRKSLQIGRRVEGRRGYVERDPELARHARRLARKNPHTGKTRSLRKIADELADLGYQTRNGTPFNATQIRRLLTGKARPPRDSKPGDMVPNSEDGA